MISWPCDTVTLADLRRQCHQTQATDLRHLSVPRRWWENLRGGRSSAGTCGRWGGGRGVPGNPGKESGSSKSRGLDALLSAAPSSRCVWLSSTWMTPPCPRREARQGPPTLPQQPHRRGHRDLESHEGPQWGGRNDRRRQHHQRGGNISRAACSRCASPPFLSLRPPSSRQPAGSGTARVSSPKISEKSNLMFSISSCLQVIQGWTWWWKTTSSRGWRRR